MSTCGRLVWVMTLLATPAGAQSSTEDGIRAMLGGDYHVAGRILRPLADASIPPDPVAQFLLAILYDTGHGGDNTRACGLFLRAATPANPFMHQSSTIGGLLQDELGGPGSRMCIADEQWQGGPPQAFVLAPGHRIVFADTTTTVTYGEKEQRSFISLPAGAAFLPIHYTPLTVTAPNVGTRHFFQLFAWTPDRTVNPSSWTLMWTLSEVVGEEWIVITSDRSLSFVDGPARPISFDAADLVRVRVNASGESELAFMGGSSPRTEVIGPQGTR